MGLQQELALPFLPYRFAVISAEDAAGYRDFVKHLDENPYGFKVELDLFPALMQGKDCPESIVAAMDRVLDSQVEYDAVLILRGGGAKLDLACFDDYSLAAVIAQYPMPVLTAVGHDQDFHVCDMVAHEYVKTPTALADFILEIYEDEDERISALETRMRLGMTNRLYREESLLDSLAARIKGAFQLKIAAVEANLNMLQARIEAADPRRILQRGYVLATDADGVVLKGVSGRSEGDKVSMMFADGALDCTVTQVRKNV
jgi:exodeoxyribonuclease VII large subunit